jgi:hypothetical protein
MVQTFKNKNLRSKSIDFEIDYDSFKHRYTINGTNNKLSNFLETINLDDIS